MPIFEFSVAYFLGALVLNLVLSPFVDRLPSGLLIETMLMTLVLLSALFSVAGRRRAVLGVVLVAPAAIGEWLNYWRPETLIDAIGRGAGLLFIGFVTEQSSVKCEYVSLSQEEGIWKASGHDKTKRCSDRQSDSRPRQRAPGDG
jgi:hypothetical protein